MPYTLKLLGLECFRAEEIDGDEIYVTLNGVRIWQAHPDRMGPPPAVAGRVSHFDFAAGRKLTAQGWIPMMPFNPSEFTHRHLTDAASVQLWDADTLTSDDLLGETPIDESQAGGGSISVVFQRLGAHYRLTYKVEVEA
jgi:hypothetical protein